MRSIRSPLKSFDSGSITMGLSFISYGLLVVAVATTVLTGNIFLCLGYLLLSLSVHALSVNNQ